MRFLILGLSATLLAGTATAQTVVKRDHSELPRGWGCKVDRQPAWRAPKETPAAAAASEERLYRLDQPGYCDAPKPVPRREQGRTPKLRI